MNKIILMITISLVNVSTYGQWNTSNNDYLYTTDKVGIGTTYPTEKLEVYNSSTTPGVLSLKSTRNDAQHVEVGRISAKQFSTEVARIGLPRAGGTYTGYVTFWTKSDNNAALTEKVRISAEGNIGIGTDDVPTRLTIASDQTKFLTFDRTGTSKNAHIGYGAANEGGLYLGTDDSQYALWVQQNGNIGIGTYNPTQRLSVAGTINADEIILEDVDGADFVFEEDYDLRSLEETEQFIHANKHLPEIPSATEMAEEGLEIKEMNILLLQKVEELTLHLIEQNKRIVGQEERIEKLEKVNAKLLKKLANQ